MKVLQNTADRFPDQQIKTAGMGAGLSVARTYDAVGRIATIKTTLSNNAGVTTPQNATFGFDTLGNLTSRSDSSAIPSLNENFCYDVLNRVKGSIGSCNTFNYDGAGNVTKPGVALAYTAATNRLSSVDGLGVTYDAGGNVKSDGSRIYSYTPYDVPDRISQGNQWMEFGFTGNGQRAYERDGANATASGITYFAGPGFFEQDNTIANGVTTVSETREFLATPAGTIGMVVTNSTGSTMSLYLQDHLGSNVASVNATTGVVTRSSYDVWGVRSATLDKGNRGYTGHEHLDFGLIHMNGRVYDPRWGRFLQADPIVQDPEDLQSFNRYSYVMNSPLSFIDPSGFSARSFNRFITRFTALHGDFAHSYIDRRWGMRAYNDPYVRTVAGAVAAYFTYGAVSSYLAGAAAAGGSSTAFATVAVSSEAGGVIGASLTGTGTAVASAAAGFAAGGIQGGNLQSAIYGAVGGGVAGGLGSLGILGQAIGGGVNGYLQTGNGSGAARGFAAGLLPGDLGLTYAYNNNPYANLAIGVVRDGLRGAIVANNRDGFGRGVALGQTTNLIGHAFGLLTTGGAPKFDRGAFVYEGDFWKNLGALTLGNVISGPRGLTTDLTQMYAHERNHVFQQYEQSLGATYIPAHLIDVGIGCLGGAIGLGTRFYLFEQHSQAIPYSTMNVNPCGGR